MFLRVLVLLVNKPDSGRGMDKEARRTVAEEAELFFCRPVIRYMSTSLKFEEVVSEEPSHVAVGLVRLNFVKDEGVCCFGRYEALEAFLNVWLWATGDQELDLWHLNHELPKDRQDR